MANFTVNNMPPFGEVDPSSPLLGELGGLAYNGPMRLLDWGGEFEYLAPAGYMRLFHLDTALGLDNKEKSFRFDQNGELTNKLTATYATKGLCVNYYDTTSAPNDNLNRFLWVPDAAYPLDPLNHGLVREEIEYAEDVMLDFAVRDLIVNSAGRDAMNFGAAKMFDGATEWGATNAVNHIYGDDVNHKNYILNNALSDAKRRPYANVVILTSVRVNLETDGDSTQDENNPEHCSIWVDFIKEYPAAQKMLFMPADKWPRRVYSENLRGLPIQKGANILFKDEAIPLLPGDHLVIRLGKPSAWLPKSYRVHLAGYEMRYQQTLGDDAVPGSLNLDGDQSRPAGATLNGGVPYRLDDFAEGVMTAE